MKFGSKEMALGLTAIIAILTVPYGVNAQVKSHAVDGTATTEALACQQATKIAKIGFSKDELISISPCRCEKKRDYHYLCVVDVTYQVRKAGS